MSYIILKIALTGNLFPTSTNSMITEIFFLMLSLHLILKTANLLSFNGSYTSKVFNITI